MVHRLLAAIQSSMLASFLRGQLHSFFFYKHYKIMEQKATLFQMQCGSNLEHLKECCAINHPRQETTN